MCVCVCVRARARARTRACECELESESESPLLPLELTGSMYLDLGLDQYVVNHPFTGIGVMVGVRSSSALLTPAFARADLKPSTDFWWTMVSSRTLGSMNGDIGQCMCRGHSSIYRYSECSFRPSFVTGTCFCLSWSGWVDLVLVSVER